MNEIPLLEAKQITKTFLDPSPLLLLKGIDFVLPKEKSVAIIGKSGEGKTTLLHILGTIDEPTSGKLYFEGKEIRKSEYEKIRNRHFGFVFQAFHLLDDATCLENLLMPVKIGRNNVGHSSSSYKRALELLDRVGLTSRIHYSCKKLSGGEKQRVAIARALICNPDIIFADEPTGNLDHMTQDEIQKLLFSCVKEEGKSLLLVTHNIALAKQCDIAYQLENGILQPA